MDEVKFVFGADVVVSALVQFVEDFCVAEGGVRVESVVVFGGVPDRSEYVVSGWGVVVFCDVEVGDGGEDRVGGCC